MKIKIALMLVLLVGLFMTSTSKAFAGCSSYTTSSTCSGKCGGTKSNGLSYQCKWVSGGCHEGAALCGSTNTSGGVSCTTSTQGYNGTGTQCCVPGGTTSYDPVTGQPYQGTHWTTCTAGYTCRQGYGCFPPPTRPPTITTPPPPTTPPTPPPTAQCVNVKMYTPAWSLVTTAQFFNFSAGNHVYFCVTGATSSTTGLFDAARFTINGVTRTQTTVKRPGSNDFCDLYTIPAGIYSLKVQGEVHHSLLGWN